mgnify:CR=1 FL=1
MKIQIIGIENSVQKQLKKNVEDIIHELGLECTLDIIHHMDEILKVEEKQIVLTPALIVDDKIVCQGHLWTKEHIKSFMQQSCSKKEQSDDKKTPDKFAFWKGIPREEIEWAPMVNSNKCVGCGMCITSCGRKVFDYDKQNKKSLVARPLQCMVGCTSCRTWCIYDAISFPKPQYVKDLIKEKGILAKVKHQIKE